MSEGTLYPILHALKKDLTNHILDRVEYYTDCGFDEETATKNIGANGRPNED